MNHIQDIECLIKTLVQSPRFHALIVESPAGWGKSSTLERTLGDLNLPYHAIGAYVTPLALYNALAKHPNDILLLDDCAGLFGDSIGMSILKAASWASAGSQGARLITWNSTSERVIQPSIKFSGKLILLANSIPDGRDMRAFLSRTLHLQIRFNHEQTAEMLHEASKQTEYFEDSETAEKVAGYLAGRVKKAGIQSINLRTLQMAYELARANPENWQSLLGKLVPESNPTAIMESLSQSEFSVEEQCREFSQLTGLSRRTFFYYRASKQLPEFNLPRRPIAR